MANETAKQLAARVRELRETLGLSQEAFAEKAGLKYKHYQSWEAGRKIDVRLSTIEKFAMACGIELWELMNFDSLPAILAEDSPKPGRSSTTRRRRKR